MAASSDPVRAGAELLARDYRGILKDARPEELDLPTNGTAWTNRQLLFHMLLGQRITRIVIVVMGVFSRLPAGASRGWAAEMAAATPLYNRLNFLGGVVGGRLFSMSRLGRQMEAVTAKILGFYDHARPDQMARGMTIPSSWDPYFSIWMDRAQLRSWASRHSEHHRRQLTLSTLPPLGVGGGSRRDGSRGSR